MFKVNYKYANGVILMSIVNSEHISLLVLVILSLTLSR